MFWLGRFSFNLCANIHMLKVSCYSERRTCCEKAKKIAHGTDYGRPGIVQQCHRICK